MEEKDIEARVEKARALFQEGYNCAQAVFLTYSDMFGMDTALAARLAASFGGGMGRMREVCGDASVAPRKRPCVEFVATAARIVGEKLAGEK